MKKLVVLSFVFVLLLTSCAKKNVVLDKDAIRIAVFTTGGVDDKSFNQVIYDSAKEFVEIHGGTVKNYPLKTTGHDAVTDCFNQANAEHANVIILPGYTFTRSVIYIAAKNPDIKFICIDISEESINNYAPDSWKLGRKFPENIYCCKYMEVIAGFLAGYAVVKEGYTRLGFAGGKAVPAVVDYGFGFLQGVQTAANVNGIANQVTVDYAYSKGFESSPTITESVRQWYENGVQAVFACGGGIWRSVCEAAKDFGGKVIGVDVDQSQVINEYATDMCLTSAVKDLGKTVDMVLNSIFDKTFDEMFGGKSQTLGLGDSDDISDDYVRLPTESWAMKNFTRDDYTALVKNIHSKKITVLDTIPEKAQLDIQLKIHPNLK